MNLVEDTWIPVLFVDGSGGRVSLRDAFSRGRQISDLAVRPHERIALMRLLICITQAALDGPMDHRDWLQCRQRIANTAVSYLAEWRRAFELFGDGQRFLQVPKLEQRAGAAPDTPITKLDVAMATGHNPTLFDNGGGSSRGIEHGRAALGLLTFQCFSVSGRIGVALWAGKATGNGSSDHAPCVSRSMLHTYVRGANLLDSVRLNLLHKKQIAQLTTWGQPVWEHWPESGGDKDAILNATETYLGRLVPISRAIRLWPDSERILNADGLSYPPQREATATEVVKGKRSGDERVVLSASLDRGTWRELSAITVKRMEGGGPLSLQNLPDDKPFDIWAGGLVADKAKLVGSVESVFHVPAAMGQAAAQRLYEHGVRLADDASKRVFRAVNEYWREYSRAPGKKSKKEGLRDAVSSSKAAAQRYFWTAVEEGVPDLLAAVETSATFWAATDWGRFVKRTAREALNAACPSATPRQIRAFSKALQVLDTSVSDGHRTDSSGSDENG